MYVSSLLRPQRVFHATWDLLRLFCAVFFYLALSSSYHAVNAQQQQQQQQQQTSSQPFTTTAPAVPSSDTFSNTDTALEEQAAFFIIIDAGSSGSRIHVHPFFVSKSVIPKVLPSKTLKITPGLSSFKDSPVEGARSLVRLLDFAKQEVPMQKWRETPIFLKATAGLRSIPTANAEAVLEECRSLLLQYPFRFHPSWAEVISGTQEGVYGWISANYLEGTLENRQVPTVGVIEMGGASLQISFVPNQIDHSMPLEKVQVGDRQFLLYTHSYLNYGLEAAQQMFADFLAKEIGGSVNPCYLRSSPLTANGGGSHQMCWDLLDGLFPRDCSFVRCSFGNVYQPKLQGERFYAIENFFYTMEFFGIHNEQDAIDKLEIKGEEYCSLDWDESKARFKARDTDLNKYCFSSAYLPKIIEQGLGLTPQNSQLKTVHDINGVKIDWALGAVVYELTKFFSSLRTDGVVSNDGVSNEELSLLVPTPSYISLQFLKLISMLAMALILLALFIRKKRAAKAGIYWRSDIDV